ncbi:glycosyltransferase [Actinobacillus equuli]|uniref:glycosyltransferase n=1 Tax=Actinobacillus equuli TaxID=718 RepID=UPI002442D118|nr:glycosyltransferase [Actinobacillus equuli]WGE48588.1 glycosyltransferase [Actinobacillus equuli subsp. equuli]
MKHKVLHFSQVLGGVGRYLELYDKYIDKDLFENIYILPIGAWESNDSRDKRYILNIGQSFSPINLVTNIIKIRQILRKEKPDIFYLHSTFAGVIGRFAAISMGCKIIYNPHGWSFKMNVSKLKQTFYKIVEGGLAFLTDMFVLISKSEYEAARSIGVSEMKCCLIYNGIETTRKTDIATIPSLDTKYVIGMIGRISEQKNPMFFAQFAKEILKQHPNTYFILVGDGEQRKQLEEYLERNNLNDAFYITGWVTNPESYLNLFDQAVLFSKWEGFGLAVAEYMAYNKPVIVTGIDGIRDLIQNEINGFTIVEGDLNDSVNKSNRLRNEPKTVAKFIEASNELIQEKFNAKKMVSSLEKLFIKLSENK